ncbi:unnamed protein product [Rotaria magnacalcarata]|uniref:MAGE domain-containing protein n=3 Tax=Rotaria magnacalcarata TaxID=392030 RepID=A0A816D2N1_9BILA|nr:unnamed protein product [Rotaria magnacalcarata]CAF1630086.1 unnamed protein product [Rotaria magnacalcarata]CAF2012885.1 unnamed protein product [Rotaria magnacalcarata]CAF2054665.1 unnamed protein product [Rotaria magnacalcarata]CAF2129042.1 unnamed protein product [Rotaria magnacalcarata]
MPAKKSSQVVTQSQISIHNGSSDDHDDEDNHILEDDANIRQMVCASIQYILVHSSKLQVIKRLEWINTVLRPMAYDGRKYFPSVHKHVVKILNDTFGYKLVLDEKHDGYVVVNALRQGPLEHRPLANSNQYSKYALLMIIVTCLKRAGGEMASVDFWGILGETFSIRNDESTRLSINQHKIFGDVQKLIKTDFVKDGYLIFDQAKDFTGDTPTQTVKLGFRAQQEFPDETLEKFIEKIDDYGIESDKEEENENNAMDEDN